MKSDDSINGVLLVDKGQDMTSHDVVAVARRCLNTKKIGHCGTLDPMATGMLILVVGTATRSGRTVPFEGGLDIEAVGTKRRIQIASPPRCIQAGLLSQPCVNFRELLRCS